MRFKDLEVDQEFRWTGSKGVCTKIGPSTYKSHGSGAANYVSKEARNGGRRWDVVPESEPPSSIEAAKRDARWWLLTDMTIKADEVRALRDREGIGIFEAQRRIKQANLQSGLDVLHLELSNGTEANQVLHDLIEIVRELV